ncbi:isochorismatase domain-containing protein 1-like [Neodiprion virginianus]|uniref:isochorismatase domain-containing protein 1-like n=1 Tax=Neodiprion fabricii TaxID=2872261 RepID=UPI001ED92F8E|nr:isochorismatase domain-containing protein 1-like [Neodiprion fabricii]XP_046611232.1 isochorismatase domain-containing protein 1-like [Neodiprion virginianus]
MALSATKAILRHGKTALFVCDMQVKFAKAIFEFDKIVANSAKLVNGMRLLDVPIIVTEQNPKALGNTVSELDITGAKGPFAKTKFSMYTEEVRKELSTLCSGSPPESVVLIGIEAHVCVEQTALDLTANGFQVHAVADCCSSRTQEDRLLAIERMRQVGCQIATSESVLFKLLGDSKHEKFKELQRLVKEPSVYTGLVPSAKI